VFAHAMSKLPKATEIPLLAVLAVTPRRHATSEAAGAEQEVLASMCGLERGYGPQHVCDALLAGSADLLGSRPLGGWHAAER
jgi:hypothetical protein